MNSEKYTWSNDARNPAIFSFYQIIVDNTLSIFNIVVVILFLGCINWKYIIFAMKFFQSFCIHYILQFYTSTFNYIYIFCENKLNNFGIVTNSFLLLTKGHIVWILNLLWKKPNIPLKITYCFMCIMKCNNKSPINNR